MPTGGPARGRALAPVALLGLVLAGCASEPRVGSYDAGQGTYRVGVPYQIKGVWYYPKVDYDYDTTGIASWYGEQFEGRLTANGEIFDLNQLTAAHTTLPMPSIVQVTNLENGRSLQLRVNDRGPFVDGRLIDVSRRSAQLLGFEKRGTTLVRVKVLKDESIAAAEEAMHGRGQILVAEASTGAAAATMTSPRAAYLIPATSPPMASAAPVASRHAAAPPKAAPIAPPPPVPPPQIAMAPGESTAPPSLATVSSRVARPAPSRFSLIGSAEAAELPPPKAAAHNRALVAAPIPTPRRPPSPLGVAAVPSSSPGRIFIQAGAFSVRDNAQRMQSRVALLASAQVTTASVNGVEMYRVRLGPFRSAAEADRLLTRLVDNGYREARVVGD